LHDGAVIIRGDQIIAAKVILPLADISARTEQHGTRHKAALGISEQSDAIIVVVSEETGNVSLAHSGKLITKLDRERLRYNLRTLLEPAPGLGLGRRNGRRKPLTTSAKNQDGQPKNTRPAVKEDGSSVPKPARTVKDTLAHKDSRGVKEEAAQVKGSSTTVSSGGNGIPAKETTSIKSGGAKETVLPNGNGAKEAVATNGNGNKDTVPVNESGGSNRVSNLTKNGEAGQKEGKTITDEQAPAARSDKR
jgi:hypothetical protein